MRKILNFKFLIFNLRKIHKGFTLIELLVAIAIIGILSGILLANFIGIRQRARDGVRKSDLRQIQSALELYRSDMGNYPTIVSLTCGYALTSEGVVNPPSGTVYMTKIPCDPSLTTPYFYNSQVNTEYILIACLENTSDPQRDVNNIWLICPNNSNTKSYSLKNP